MWPGEECGGRWGKPGESWMSGKVFAIREKASQLYLFSQSVVSANLYSQEFASAYRDDV